MAQNVAVAQPAFSALVVPSGHIQILLVLFFFFPLGAPMQLSPCLSMACVPFFWLFTAAVQVGCENELLGESAGWVKVEGWLWGFFQLPKPQCAGSLGVLYSKKIQKFFSRLQGNMEASTFKGWQGFLLQWHLWCLIFWPCCSLFWGNHYTNSFLLLPETIFPGLSDNYTNLSKCELVVE